MAEEGVRVAYNNAPVVTEKLIQRYVELNLRQGQRRASALRFALDRRPYLHRREALSIRRPSSCGDARINSLLFLWQVSLIATSQTLRW